MTASYTALSGEADYRAALDRVLALAAREIRIFDPDLVAMRLDESARIDALTRFLLGAPDRRISIVVHDPEPAEKHMPRLLNLLARHSHAVTVRRSPDNLRHLADAHLLADDRHGVRRFHVTQPRSALIEDDRDYIHPWWDRFGELWESSQSCLGTSVSGL